MTDSKDLQPGDLRPGEDGVAPPASTEVQFALVIARMLETVQNHPEHMRQVVYDLARYKLREQFSHADVRDIGRSKRALEVAIQGVEEFARQQVAIPPPSSPQAQASSLPALRKPTLHEVHRSQHPQIEADDSRAVKPRHSIWSVTKRAALLLILAGIAVLAVQQRERLASLAKYLQHQTQKTAATALPTPVPVVPTEPAAPAKPRALTPKDYGVYAIVDDQSLAELQLLPGRPPDIRVAVSAAFRVPDQASLPHGHPKFIVFRRDAVSNILERAEVRVIAKVAREFSAEATAKKPGETDDAFVIRNASYPFRASPIPENPEMYELHSEDPALELPPGRYALILKAQAYYFSVSGDVTDPRQCIERVIAANGTFYTDCKKP